ARGVSYKCIGTVIATQQNRQTGVRPQANLLQGNLTATTSGQPKVLGDAPLGKMTVEDEGRLSLMAEAFQLAGARLGHAAHAFAGIDPGDGALAQAVIQAIGVAVRNP